MRLLHAALVVLTMLRGAEILAADELVFSPLADVPEETRALVGRVLQGYGGESNVGSVNQLYVASSIVQVERDGEFRMTIESLSSFPERHVARIRTEQGTMTLAIDGGDAYLVPARAAVKGAAIRLTEEERNDLVGYFVSDPFFVIRNRRSSRILFAAGGTERVNGVECRRLHVLADGMSIAWLVDLASGRIVRTETGDESSEMSDWRQSGPVTIPHRVKTMRGGKRIAEARYVAYEVNPHTIDVARQLRKPDLWLMRWKVQPKAGATPMSASMSGASNEATTGSSKTAATYRPPVVDAPDASVVIWDPSGIVPQ